MSSFSSSFLDKVQIAISLLYRCSLLTGAALSLVSSAKANVVNARYTWIAQDRQTVGMLSKDAMSGVQRWGWSTNGNVFDCLETGRTDELVEVSCPRIDYRFHLYADHALLDSPGATGQNLGAGNWDDRRFWFGSNGNANFMERFYLKDNFKWAEDQYTNNQQTGHFDFVETGRDKDFIYLYDASRSTSVALGLKQVFVKNTSSVPNWTKFYDGTF